MSLRRALFGPSKDEVWQLLAPKIHGNFVGGGMWKESRIDVHVGEWIVTLDTYTVHTGHAHVAYTRFRAPYVNRDGFRFTITRKNVFSAIGVFFGMQDVEVGFPDIDRQFIIKGTDEGKLAGLFGNVRFRTLLEGERSLRLEVKDDEGWFGGKFPEGVDELCLQVQGVVTEFERLENLYDLFSLTLQQLCHIGSAYSSDPHMTL